MRDERLIKPRIEAALTYRSLVYLGASLGGVSICVHQILLDTQIHLHLFKIGRFDSIALIGLAISIISGWLSFKQLGLSEASERDARMIREIDENRQIVDKFEKKLDNFAASSSERTGYLQNSIYALRVDFESHTRLEIHPMANKKLAVVEREIYRVSALFSY